MITMVAGAISAIFWGALLLTFLVFIHEGGHFLAARANRVRVTEFFIGMPSRFRLSRRSARFGTEFGVTPLLLGGYNRVCGLEGPTDAKAPDVLACVAKHGRVSTGQIASECDIDPDRALDILIGLADLASVQPYYDAAKGEHPYQRTYPDTWETLARDAHGLTIYDEESDFSAPGCTEAGEPHELHMFAQEFYDRERAHTFSGVSLLRKLSILLAGVVVNLLFGMLLFVFVLSAVGVDSYVDENRLGAIIPDTVAEAAGLQEGDVISAVDGVATTTWTEISDALSVAREAGSTVLSVTRGSEDFEVELVLREGDELFGVSAPTGLVRLPLSRSIPLSFSYVGSTAQAIAQLFIPAHTMEVVENSSSVVGISVMASEAAEQGASTYLFLVAAVSLSLGFMNLIPIPLLDGGKVLLELVAALIKRPVPKRVQAALSYVGLFLLGALFVYTLHADIVRIVTGVF